jgi:hypothetical protein
MKMLESLEAEEIASDSSSKDHKYGFKVKNPIFSIDMNRPAPVEERP